jgi:hypothetical protein
VRRGVEQAGICLRHMHAAQGLERNQGVDEPREQEVKEGAGAVALQLRNAFCTEGRSVKLISTFSRQSAAARRGNRRAGHPPG